MSRLIAMMTCYDDAMRTIIDLPEEQLAALRELCEREKISRAEAIRRAVACWLAEDEKADRKRALDESFGAWKHKGIDADEFIRELRDEWER